MVAGGATEGNTTSDSDRRLAGHSAVGQELPPRRGPRFVVLSGDDPKAGADDDGELLQPRRIAAALKALRVDGADDETAGLEDDPAVFEPNTWDLAATLEVVRGATHVLCVIDPADDESAHEAAARLVEREAPGGHWTWVGCLSILTTAGEDDTKVPVSEARWLATGAPVHAFRADRAVSDFDDAAQCVARSMKRPNPGRVYNVCRDRVAGARARSELGFVPHAGRHRACAPRARTPRGQRGDDSVHRGTRPSARRFAAILAWIVVTLRRLARAWRWWWWRWWLRTRRRRGLVLLVDIGSVRAGATLGARRLSRKLETELGIEVRAASLRFADRIPPDQLDGEPATLVKDLDVSSHAAIAALPLFLSPSESISTDLRRALPPYARIGAPLVDLVDAEACHTTRALIRVAATAIRPGETRAVVLVDHGSPNPAVTRVRRALAARLRRALYPLRVVDASMERRPGARYAFNEPLLERVFDLGGLERGDVLVVLAFLFPGAHAGEGGDVDTILRGAAERHPGLALRRLPVLVMDSCNDDLWVPELARRAESVLMDR